MADRATTKTVPLPLLNELRDRMSLSRFSLRDGREELVMTTEPPQLQLEPDWAELILEVQTAPDESLGQAQGALYQAIFPWVDDIAARFAHQHGIADCDVDTLFNLGIEQVLKKIDQFDQRADGKARLARQFKAWVATVCRNRWRDEYRKTRRDYEHYQSDQAAQEDGSWDGAIHQRSPADWARLTEALQRCLEKYPEHYQKAIVEYAALREEQGTRNNARGRGGEAKAIAEKYGMTQENLRQCRRRVNLCAKAEYAKEHDK